MPEATTAIMPISPANMGGSDTLETAAKKDRDYYEFQFAAGVFSRLVNNFTEITTETRRQQALRYVKGADSELLRSQGVLNEQQLYCPVRLIDSNIRAEQPALVQYLTQSRRSIIFASPDPTPPDGLEKLEQDFTTKARYLGWEVPWLRVVDGSQAHGWDAVEIKFDPGLPGDFCIEHIGHDRLIFCRDSEDLEAQEVLAIKMNLTANQLREMVKEGWSATEVESLIASNAKESGLMDCLNEVYKIYFKQDEKVHVCYWSRNCSDYLKSPEPLFLGVRDLKVKLPTEIDPVTQLPLPSDYAPEFETEFPIVLLPYIESEDPTIVELRGRCKLDEPSQEAASAVNSGLVNRQLLSANVFASPTQQNIAKNGSIPALTDVAIRNGALYDQPINFFSPPEPGSAGLTFLNNIITLNKSETSQVNFAATNRKDSEKTATEIQSAEAQKMELSSVKVILLSIFVRKVYAKCWRIYQNRVLQGKIIIKDPSLLQLFASDIQLDESGAVVSCGEPAYYIIKSSGDVDVIQRQEKLQRLMQGWEVFGKTALAPEYLKDIIRYSFPEDAARYVAILEQAEMNQLNQAKMLLQKTAGVAQALATDPQTGQLVPAAQPMQAELQQLAMEVTNFIQQPAI